MQHLQRVSESEWSRRSVRKLESISFKHILGVTTNDYDNCYVKTMTTKE